jgi:K+-transporting ATPase KdpF subunit
MNPLLLISLVLSIVLLGYLVFVMIFPQKF